MAYFVTHQARKPESVPVSTYMKYTINWLSEIARLAVFTLEDEQTIWTDKSSDVKTGLTNFSANKLSEIWPSGKTIFPEGLSVETNKSMTVRHKRIKVKNDHCSKFSNLTNWKEEA